MSIEKSKGFAFMAGYSGTPLVRKLGIRPDERVIALDAPDHYEELLGELPARAKIETRLSARPEFVHLFVVERDVLAERLSALRRKLNDTGMVWVSWPKKAAKVPTDITEDVVRDVALPLGFVDIKVCAVDEKWSGLKLVIRRTERGAK